MGRTQSATARNASYVRAAGCTARTNVSCSRLVSSAKLKPKPDPPLVAANRRVLWPGSPTDLVMLYEINNNWCIRICACHTRLLFAQLAARSGNSPVHLLVLHFAQCINELTGCSLSRHGS